MGVLKKIRIAKIDLETGRVEYRGSLPKVLASFGIQNQPKKIGIDMEAAPEINGRPKQKTKLRKSNTVTAGAQDVTRLYPAGKRLLKPERNLSLAHAPRDGGMYYSGAGIATADASEGESAIGTTIA